MSERSISPFERFGGPSPYSEARAREHVFAAFETFTGLAHRYYKDWRLWRTIAERNDIADVRQVEPGTRLLIPDRPLESGRYESA